MFDVATRAAILIVALSSCRSSNNLTAAKPPSYDISDVLETSYEIREEANKIRGEAFNLISRALTMKEEALELREETYSARSELERSLLETLALVKANAVSTAQNIAEIKDSLEGMSDRMEKLEEKVGSNAQMTELIKKRQELWASEIRLISLYKMTDQTSTHAQYHSSDHAVDGQFSFAKNVHDWMSVFSMTNSSPNNKLNIHLGGLFRINRVKIWNIRFCCQDRIVGTRVYADHRQIGVVIQTKSLYEFNVSTEDPTYGQSDNTPSGAWSTFTCAGGTSVGVGAFLRGRPVRVEYRDESFCL